MTSRVDIVGPGDLDFDAFASLQSASFAEVVAKAGGAGDYMTPEFFRWKYRPPAGDARIAVVYDGSELVAANAMYPVTVRLGEDRLKAWQSCDTATAPRARGRGLFTKCIAALGETVGDDEIFFGFPNANSIKGFTKLGWETKALVTTWVAPLDVGALLSGAEVVERPDGSADGLAQSLSEHPWAWTERTTEYFGWRYRAHPIHRYTVLEVNDGSGLRGVCVVRRARALNREVAVVMDLAAISASEERRLLSGAQRWAFRQRLTLTVLLDSGLATTTALCAAMAPVPARLLPKRQYLMGSVRGRDTVARRVFDGAWRVQTGDWDAF